MEQALATAHDELAAVTAERDELATQLAAQASALGEANTELATARDELDVLRAERDRLTAAVATAEQSVAAAPVESPATPRDCGPLADNAVLTLDDLRAAIGAADDVQVVFSDGQQEILTLQPLRITGAAWVNTVPGLKLAVPGLLILPTEQVEIAGYALFLDGKQAAWSPRPDVLRIPAGQQSDISNDVVFPG
ncbi:hypothetical protein [Novosphingobium sp. FKTRR1]|uniref:hypothetical protein n=1 Tax=Novosphingobium sp. FKTRR1 TaxID=2879118 RepID=UPI001CF06DDD|nr:hypothetical protein [Novosphingobium sp. FKTRR1]